MENKELMETDLKAQLLKELEDHPAWRLFRDHLQELCRRKEVVKSRAVRIDDRIQAMQQQFEIDGINLVVSELPKLITSLSSQKAESF